MTTRRSTSRPRNAGWTLVEMLAALGIIAVLFGLLLPVLSGAWQHANLVKCQSNLRALGQALNVYANENNGWMYPVDVSATTGKIRLPTGTASPPHARWPAIVFKVPAASAPLPYNPASYTLHPYDPATFPADAFTPKVLICPSDNDPWDSHSYVLNGHLGLRGFRRGNRDLGGRTSAEVILAGEKYTLQRDYFMQDKDFDRVVEAFRHGKGKGSNYLFLDGHAETQLPREVRGGIDPWDVTRSSQR